jgi:hypothetical protein
MFYNREQAKGNQICEFPNYWRFFSTLFGVVGAAPRALETQRSPCPANHGEDAM